MSKYVIEWSKVKYTPMLVSEYSNGINPNRTILSINGYTIPISERGIELEWWSSTKLSETELKMPIPEYLRKYIQLKEIHLTTGAILEHIFPTHTYENMVLPQVYDFLRRRNMKQKNIVYDVEEPDILMEEPVIVTEQQQLEQQMAEQQLEQQQMAEQQLEQQQMAEQQLEQQPLQQQQMAEQPLQQQPLQQQPLQQQPLQQQSLQQQPLQQQMAEQQQLEQGQMEEQQQLEQEIDEEPVIVPRYIVEGQAPIPEEPIPEEPLLDEPEVELQEETIEFASKGLPLLLWNTILGRGGDAPEMAALEDCINKMMMTEHNDEEHIQRIRNYEFIHQLGNPVNRSDLLYVQSKIIRFITLDPKDVFKCLDIVYIIPEDFCAIGLTGDSMKVLASLLDVNVDVQNKTQMKHTKVVYDLLVKYVPDIIKKIIDISEEYENNKCNGEPHPNTVMMKNIYKNLFLKNNMMAFNMPDLGLSEFFIDFKQNILTKVILLAFIAFVFSKLISLFNIQYHINK